MRAPPPRPDPLPPPPLPTGNNNTPLLSPPPPWPAGMFKFPLWNLGPLNAYGRALIARRQLLEIFEKDVAAARARAARGEEVPGQLGMMLEAMPPSPKNDA